VLGEMIESNFRRALVISKGSYDIFLTHPVTVSLLLLAVLSFALPLIATLRGKRRPVLVEEE
jgi:putative tricarboxylic transport membrane protein